MVYETTVSTVLANARQLKWIKVQVVVAADLIVAD